MTLRSRKVAAAMCLKQAIGGKELAHPIRSWPWSASIKGWRAILAAQFQDLRRCPFRFGWFLIQAKAPGHR